MFSPLATEQSLNIENNNILAPGLWSENKEHTGKLGTPPPLENRK